MESVLSEAWLMPPPSSPMITSAAPALLVGTWLNTSTRSLPPSATNSRRPSDSAKRGKFMVFSQRSGYVGRLVVESVPFEGHSLAELLASELVMSGWPTTTSAAAKLDVGIEFQMSTRLCPRSVTYSRTPSEVTETGLLMLLEVASLLFLVKSGSTNVVRVFCPRTRSADAPFEVGIELKISTR